MCAGKSINRPAEIGSRETDDAEVIPDTIDRAIETAAAREIVKGSIEFAHREVAVAAPAEQQRIVGSIARPRLNVAIASRNCRAPDCATPSWIIRWMLRGSATSALSAWAIAPVSGCDRYSTPAGERYCTDCAADAVRRRP